MSYGSEEQSNAQRKGHKNNKSENVEYCIVINASCYVIFKLLYKDIECLEEQ